MKLLLSLCATLAFTPAALGSTYNGRGRFIGTENGSSGRFNPDGSMEYQGTEIGICSAYQETPSPSAWRRRHRTR